MNRKLAIPLLFVSLGYAGSGLIAQELLDPFTRDEDISGTEVTATVNRLADGNYEYRYTVAAPPENKGRIRGIMIDLACDLAFGDVTFPEAPDPLFGGDFSTVQHVPVRMYIDPVHTTRMTITADGEAYWGLSMIAGEAAHGYRLLSPAPPGLRKFRLVPSWPTDRYDYGGLSDADIDNVPWIDTFTVTGMIEAPACALPNELT